MKICDLTQAYTPKSGGIRTYIHEKQKYIEKYTSDQHLLIVPGEQDAVTRSGGFTIYTIKAPYISGCEPYRFTFRMDKVYAILQREKPDIIELGSPYIMPYPALLYRRTHNCALVGFYHTDFPTAYSEQMITRLAGAGWGRAAKRLSEWYAHQVYNRMDYTVTASKTLRNKLTKMGIERTVLVPLGVDLEQFHPSKRDLQIRKSLGIRDEQVLLIYSGRLDSEKRIDVILKAFEKTCHLYDGALLIVGQGPLMNMVVEYSGRHSRIHYIPYIYDKKTLAEILASADVYVTAGPHETFGLSIIEAQASGLPVLGVRAGALLERVDSSVGVLVEPGSVEEMARNMFELSTNGFREKGRRARILVEQEFSWTKSFKQLYRLYEISVDKN